jgi:DNA modification methylase
MKAYNSDITIEEFIAKHAKPYDPATDNYFREPFAHDILEGKSSELFQAHAYHTKLPVGAIIPYLQNYTEPGDLVFDPFCGSGMTGVACLMINRIGILSDLSPIACHIASNYCSPFPNPRTYDQEVLRILEETRDIEEQLYSTRCRKCGHSIRISFTIWSDIFRCTRCNEEIQFLDSVVPKNSGEKRTFVRCSNKKCELVEDKTYLPYLKNDPVIIAFDCRDCRSGRGYKQYPLTPEDSLLLASISNADIPFWYPKVQIDPNRELMTMGPTKRGLLSTESFYTKRNLWALAAIWHQILKCSNQRLRSFLQFTFTSIIPYVCRKQGYGGGGGGMSATLYTPSLHKEQNVFEVFRRKAKKLSKLIKFEQHTGNVIVCKTSADELCSMPDQSIDYIFTDPPFGGNIFYADASILWESWLGDFTDLQKEMVYNRRNKTDTTKIFKTIDDYAELMSKAFSHMHRVLKPGRWLSMVFSNSDDLVWQAIRDGAKNAGFDLSNTVALDKKQRSFKQVRGEKGEENVVGMDIIMNLHKRPRTQVAVQTIPDLDETVLNILRHHVETLLERIRLDSTRYSEALRTTNAFYNVVLHELMARKLSNRGVTLPYIDELCRSAFKKIEGKWYLPSEEIRAERLNLEVEDEPSAIEWVRNQLAGRPMTLGELIPLWRQVTLRVGKRLEKTLSQLLAENFWCDADTNRWRLPTEEERRQMGDERTLRMRRNIQRLREGKIEIIPKDTELFEWMVFAYQHLTDHHAVVEVYQRMSPLNLPESERKQAKRLYEFCLTQLPEQDHANHNDQLRLL